MKKAYRYTDDKGNPIYRGNVLYDTSNKKFYWVKDPVKGILITIEESPRAVLISEIEEKSYLKRWISYSDLPSMSHKTELCAECGWTKKARLHDKYHARYKKPAEERSKP